MATTQRVRLAGTEHSLMLGARAIGPSSPHQLIEISVVLKHRTPVSLNTHRGQVLSHSEFVRMYGADTKHIEAIRQFARENNLEVLTRGDEVQRRTVTLSGTAANLETAFNVELVGLEYPDGTYRSHTGPVQVPGTIAACIQGVFGLDNRPVAHPHFRVRNTNRTFGSRMSTTTCTPLQASSLYEFPPEVNGEGQTIGIIELGGGYRPADVQQYFRALGLRIPSVRAVLINHSNNRPTTPYSADAQVMLDIEMTGAAANGASLAVYFAPNTARGFQDAFSTAVHDRLHTPSVIVIGWGNPEAMWTEGSMECFDQVAQEAALFGITVIAASGDHSSSDSMVGQDQVDFPASSPHVLSVGGTRLNIRDESVLNETVWNDGPASGGGYSSLFQRPNWQQSSVTRPSRGVPDVAANADPDTGYSVLVDGESLVLGGTSAAASLWAGLIARCNQTLDSRLGFVNPALYAIHRNTAFRDIVRGSNGAFTAGTGWDPCTGLGTPIGLRLLQTLASRIGQTVLGPAGKPMAGTELQSQIRSAT